MRSTDLLSVCLIKTWVCRNFCAIASNPMQLMCKIQGELLHANFCLMDRRNILRH